MPLLQNSASDIPPSQVCLLTVSAPHHFFPETSSQIIMQLFHRLFVLGALTSSILAFTINNEGSARCLASHNRVQTIRNTINATMPETALFSEQGVQIACSVLADTAQQNTASYFAFCAWVGNSGGNIFSKAKILSMLDHLLEMYPSTSCGSVPVNYPHLRNSYSALTVNYVKFTWCNGYCAKHSVQGQGSIPQNGIPHSAIPRQHCRR